MAFRYRLLPEVSQLSGCARHCADARFVWNLALEQANCWRPGRGPTPGRVERDRQLAEARAGSWLGMGSSSVQQQALRDFDQALRNWWAGTHRRPRWRKEWVDEGFCIRDVKVRRISRKWAAVHVPKVGWVRFRLSRPLGPHGMARVTRDRAGRWHVSFSAPQPPVARTATGRAVGVDVGVVHAVTTSAGDHLDVSGLHRGEQARLLRLERKKARQCKGSNRCARTKHAIAVLHARGTLESPGRNVSAKAGLNRRIAASAWSFLVRRTTDKASNSEGCAVVRVDPRHTSQRCSSCGHLDPGNRPSQAVFSCLACGHADNADTNAAKNILAAGLAATARGGRPEVGAPGEARTDRQEAA